MLQINCHPSDREVRRFGLAALVAPPLIAAVWTGGAPTAMGITLAAGGLLAVVATMWPRELRPLVAAMNLLTAPLAVVIHDALCLAFFAVIVPVGMVFRLFGRDPLQLKIDRKAVSYWQAKKQARDARSYFQRW